jgi:hypothetical protein
MYNFWAVTLPQALEMRFEGIDSPMRPNLRLLRDAVPGSSTPAVPGSSTPAVPGSSTPAVPGSSTSAVPKGSP